MSAAFDSTVAYGYGSVVEIAYRLFAPGVVDPAIAAGQLPSGWTLLSELTAVDKVGGKTEPEFFGLLVTSPASEVLVAIRGTDTFLEWVIDAEFKPCAFPAASGAGRVEDGFCSVYNTLTCTKTGAGLRPLLQSLPAGTKVTFAGHSLGAAVATLAAADAAVTVAGIDLTLYTYASPRVGDSRFAQFCSANIPVHFRITNRPDIVPRLPPLYVATGTEIDVDSTQYPQVAHRIACYHTLTTYLWLLDQQSSYGLGTCARTPALTTTG